jgi:lipoprotein-releasing system permease protein
LVAVVGIAASLVVSTLQRRQELGFLRAQGATRGQIVAVVLAEATILSATGALIGLLMGIAMDWYTQQVILADETGFPLPFQLPVTEAILATAISILAAMVAGWGPAHHAAHQSIAVATASE